jgi:hypothetical protein
MQLTLHTHTHTHTHTQTDTCVHTHPPVSPLRVRHISGKGQSPVNTVKITKL